MLSGGETETRSARRHVCPSRRRHAVWVFVAGILLFVSCNNAFATAAAPAAPAAFNAHPNLISRSTTAADVPTLKLRPELATIASAKPPPDCSLPPTLPSVYQASVTTTLGDVPTKSTVSVHSQNNWLVRAFPSSGQVQVQLFDVAPTGCAYTVAAPTSSENGNGYKCDVTSCSSTSSASSTSSTSSATSAACEASIDIFSVNSLTTYAGTDVLNDHPAYFFTGAVKGQYKLEAWFRQDACSVPIRIAKTFDNETQIVYDFSDFRANQFVNQTVFQVQSAWQCATKDNPQCNPINAQQQQQQQQRGSAAPAHSPAKTLDPPPYTFLSIGDWGGNQSTGLHPDIPSEVATAAAMRNYIAASNGTVSFIASVGDNFYQYGVVDTEDANWQTIFLDRFAGPEFDKLPWYSVLGNHGYGFDPQAQVEFTSSPHNFASKWNMPQRNFVKRYLLHPLSSQHLSVVFFDSVPCYRPYHSSNNNTWDPKPPKMEPELSEYRFPENIKAGICDTTWLNESLAALPAADWKILVTHQPPYGKFTFDMVGAIRNNDLDLVLVGHVHLLSHLTFNPPAGAGEQARGGKAAAKLPHIVITGAGAKHDSSFPFAAIKKIDTVSQFNVTRISGYTAHTFTGTNYDTLTTTYFDTNNTVLHRFAITRTPSS